MRKCHFCSRFSANADYLSCRLIRQCGHNAAKPAKPRAAFSGYPGMLSRGVIWDVLSVIRTHRDFPVGAPFSLRRSSSATRPEPSPPYPCHHPSVPLRGSCICHHLMVLGETYCADGQSECVYRDAAQNRTIEFTANTRFLHIVTPLAGDPTAFTSHSRKSPTEDMIREDPVIQMAGHPGGSTC